jgi:DNA-binding NarL/FixJ family response regulator
MSTPLKAGVLIADDHRLVRDGLQLLIDAEPDLEVVATAADGVEAVQQGLDRAVHLAILDVAMPKRTGIHAARELARQRPDLRILMLSMHDVDEYFLEAVKAGASGYVLKTVADRDLVDACRAALRGETFIYPGMVRALLRDHLERLAEGEVDPEQPGDPLTPREQEVVKLVAEGHTTEEIAQALVISPRTVERHRENVLGKLGLRNRVELTRYAIRRGLVEA